MPGNRNAMRDPNASIPVWLREDAITVTELSERQPQPFRRNGWKTGAGYEQSNNRYGSLR